MRKSGWLILIALLALAWPSAARANVLVPSMVQTLLAPGPWSLSFTLLPLTVFTLFLIAGVEALAIRPLYAESWWRMTKRLFWVNAISSIAGLVYDFTRLGVWPCIALAFVLSTLLEWPLLRMACQEMHEDTTGALLRAAVRMNVASYALIAVLVALMCVPVWRSSDPAIRHEISGTIYAVAWNGTWCYTLCITPHRLIWHDQVPRRFISNTDVLTSADGRYLYHRKTGVLRDTRTGRRRQIEQVGQIEYPEATFSPREPLLAYTEPRSGRRVIVILDCRTGAERILPVIGEISHDPAWSPDGRYLAFAGLSSNWLRNHWDDEIRVMRVSDGKSIILYTKKWALYGFRYLTWTTN